MTCEKCKTGIMQATRIPRFSGCLVAIGYTLLIPSILALILATAFAVFGTFATGKATVDTSDKLKWETLDQLRRTDVPADVLSDFEEDGIIDEATLARLSHEQRQSVDRILSTYHAGAAGAALGGTLAAGVGTMAVAIVYFLCVPALIIGFILLLKKKVWHCGKCGYVFDRA